MTLLNSNFEDWRIANPTAPMDDFQFTTKKMGNSGSLFDIDKLKDVSKNTISVMSADEVYNEVTGWAKDYDQQLYTLLTGDEQKAKAIFAIGRGGAKPRKDIAIWSEVKDYLAFFYDELYVPATAYPENVAKEDAIAILTCSTRASTPLRTTATPGLTRCASWAKPSALLPNQRTTRKTPTSLRATSATSAR